MLNKNTNKNMEEKQKELSQVIHAWAERNQVGYLKIEANIGKNRLVNIKFTKSYGFEDIA